MGVIKSGQNVRMAGEDLALGQVAIAKGTQITAPELGMLASLGFADVAITRPIQWQYSQQEMKFNSLAKLKKQTASMILTAIPYLLY